MQEKLVKLLIDKKLNISFAESLTGGLCAAKIVSVADASKVLKESYVTYASEAKEKILGVPHDVILKHTVVSAEVAYYMAEGLHKITGSDVCVSLTGLAGPSGDEIHEIGTVYVGIYYLGDVLVKCFNFGNLGRNNVREDAANSALSLCYEVISNA